MIIIFECKNFFQRNETKMSEIKQEDYQIDHKRRHYPFTIVWTPVPILSWIFPHVGHLGIGKSDGHVKDFGRPYKVLTDSNQFGRPLKYWILDPSKAKDGIKGWDDAIEEASFAFCKRMHLDFYQNLATIDFDSNWYYYLGGLFQDGFLSKCFEFKLKINFVIKLLWKVECFVYNTLAVKKIN
ncbi:Neuron navigator 2 [Sarcoptes scabiei]|nr:Neuron navigator 2 [Sarcoptes scabiei]